MKLEFILRKGGGGERAVGFDPFLFSTPLPKTLTKTGAGAQGGERTWGGSLLMIMN